MTEKKTIHFISHTHWDREWYMPFEAHRHQLVRFFDRLLDTLDTEPSFRSFHLDGQAVVLEDYLAVRPQMREKIEKYIADGRLVVGPWYVLQDEYLTDGEANVRNLLYGTREAAQYGQVSDIGYFPDSFGNISQMPQILRGFGIECAALGRGVAEYPPEAKEGHEPNYGKRASEIVWRSPDGSEVAGAVFLNWYNNGAEIPSDPAAAKARVADIQARCERFAVTPHLLAMNGCDHQPVQRDIGEILGKIAPEVSAALVHGNFREYFDAILPYRDRFGVYEGELDGNYTDGMHTLANTASARIYLKQMNHACETLLERRTEPMGVLSDLFAHDAYRSDEMRFAWKSLLKNHPHDSICGCSVDEVHSGMVERFKSVRALGEAMLREECAAWESALDTASAGGERTVTVFNPSLSPSLETAVAAVDFPRDSDVTAEMLRLTDADGDPVPAVFEDLGVVFDYDLPEDAFRRPYYVRRFLVRFTAGGIAPLSWKTYRVERGVQDTESDLRVYRRAMENRYLKISFAADGSVTVRDKKTRRLYTTCMYEDTGDIGDEYRYIRSRDGKTVLSTEFRPQIRLLSQDACAARFAVTTRMTVPAGVDLSSGDRTGESVMTVETVVTLRAGMRRAEFDVTIDNRADNHRVRVLTRTGLLTDTVEADTPFDIVSRTVEPWAGWKNPERPGKMQTFFRLSEAEAGLAVAGRGLCEYEVLRDAAHTMALTLHRGVHHLGDWGVFPTPDAQCRGELHTEFALIPYSGRREALAAASRAFSYAAGELHAVSGAPHSGTVAHSGELLGVRAPEGILFSALKKCETRDTVVLRLYSVAPEEKTVKLDLTGHFSRAYLNDLGENRISLVATRRGRGAVRVGAHKIVTIELEV